MSSISSLPYNPEILSEIALEMQTAKSLSTAVKQPRFAVLPESSEISSTSIYNQMLCTKLSPTYDSSSGDPAGTIATVTLMADESRAVNVKTSRSEIDSCGDIIPLGFRPTGLGQECVSYLDDLNAFYSYPAKVTVFPNGKVTYNPLDTSTWPVAVDTSLTLGAWSMSYIVA